jgi:hypothetical protein
MLSCFAFVALIPISALGQMVIPSLTQGEASFVKPQGDARGQMVIPSLTQGEASFVKPQGDASVVKLLSTTTVGVDGIGTEHTAQNKEEIRQEHSNIVKPGHSPESLLNPSRNKGMVKSSMIASGMVEAFMHKQHLLPKEKLCLEDSVAQLTGDLVGTGQDVVEAIRALTTGVAGRRLPSEVDSKETVAVSGVDAALKLTYLASSVATLLKNCVQGDALHKLNKTAHHLVDLKHLGHRLVVSGVDIASSLADSITSYEGHDYHRFGSDIGSILRKILLSNSNPGAELPEGVPEKEVIQQASEGIMEGFFVGGSSMVVTDSARPDVNIHLDLHHCIVGNEPFFKQIFLSIWKAIAQFSANGDQHGLQVTSSAEGSPKWGAELMLALVQLPSALQRCDIDSDTQHMLMESIQTLGQVHAQFVFPQGKASVDEISQRMVKAVEYWTKWDFKKFGDELGVMLREFVLMVHPMKYSVDGSGVLRRQSSQTDSSEKIAPGIASGFLKSMIIGSFAAFIGLMAVRRMLRTQHAPLMQEVDAELGCDNLIEEQIE